MPITKWGSALEKLGTSIDFLSEVKVKRVLGKKGTYPYILVYNPNRQRNMASMRADKKVSDTQCQMCNLHEHHPDAMLEPPTSDYGVFPNKFPIR